MDILYIGLCLYEVGAPPTPPAAMCPIMWDKCLVHSALGLLHLYIHILQRVCW